ncbi:unnamed protein product [Urochloa humidicola]
MSTPSPAKAGHEARGTGTTPVKAGRVSQEEERGSGTSPVRVVRGAESSEQRGTGTTPVKVASRVEKERVTAPAPVNVKAEPGGGDGGLINIKVHSQTAADAFFRVKRDVKLRRLIDMYCGKHSLDPKTVKFLGPDGRHIRAEQTPDELGLEDGDAIDLVLDQVGGGGAPPLASQSSA